MKTKEEELETEKQQKANLQREKARQTRIFKKFVFSFRIFYQSVISQDMQPTTTLTLSTKETNHQRQEQKI